MHYLLIKIQLLWAKHTKWLDRNPVKIPVSKRAIAYAIDCCFILWGSYW